jgi:transcription-repair coupling factor (superfamily II helicase)
VNPSSIEQTSEPDFVDAISEPLQLPEDRAVVTAAGLARSALGRPGLAHVVGAEGAAPALVAAALCREGARAVLYVAADADAARRAAADLAHLARGLPLPAPHSLAIEPGAPLLLAPSESSLYAEVHPDRRAQMHRTGTLFQIAIGLPWRFLVTTATALARRVVPPEVLAGAAIQVRAEEELDLDQLVLRLSQGGYLRAPVVEDPGSFAVRGGLLDVWPATAEQPLRIELYGDLVLAIKRFDPDDQRTLEPVSELWLPPARDAITTPEAEARARAAMRARCDAVDLPSSKARQLIEDVATGKSFFGMEAFLPAFSALVPLTRYLPDGAAVVIEDPPRVVAELRAELERAQAGAQSRRELPHFDVGALFVGEGELTQALLERPIVVAHRTAVGGSPEPDRELDAFELSPPDAPTLAMRDHADLGRATKHARSARGKQGALDPLLRRVAVWREAGLAVLVTARASTQAERLSALLRHRGVELDSDVQIVVGELARGAVAPAEGFVLVTEEEIFGQRAHRRIEKKRSPRAVLEDLRALAPGDFVVHVDHGIGRYLGLDKKSIGGVSVELLVVEYGGGDKLFLPVYRLNQIQKFSGGEGAPRLDRLGGLSFAKTKAKVQRRVRQMADELLRLYAERAAVQKRPIAPADDEYATFEATFPYEETRDQAAAIGEVMKELEQPQVMDRLVCGDVGFGKTEVALRAAFRTAMAGRQVGILCPTTVLAQQHFLTFSSRLSGYPVVVRALSRFSSKADQLQTLKGLKEGSVDIVIGTHRLLSKDVHFKNLGLLVVDEEQRFGVTHKERIKQLRASVDVLTLSATPIPRTLQMAVTGLRDMSIITTPPMDRRAIRTIVSRFDEAVVREAIERELSRGGQVFYVYNRIEGIYERAQRVQALLPSARVAVAHGQMGESELERTMLDFVEGQFDVLVSTAIIESGLDIPRANTMIVDRADMFGLSQLYQLRGRVGRASERAYCYLLVPAPSEMTDEARARIEALEQHTELGAGFQIATLDMELRGAGDLLGAEQSGFVASVGFDLFCQMLEEATHELRGEPVVHPVDPELSFDVDALLPDDYVADVGVRLSLYKRLASANDESEVAEIAAEMEDRFGNAPQDAKRLVELMRLKTELRKLMVLGCEATQKSVTLHLRSDTPLDPIKVGELVGRKKSGYRLSPDGRLTRRAKDDERFGSGLELADKMLNELTS